MIVRSFLRMRFVVSTFETYFSINVSLDERNILDFPLDVPRDTLVPFTRKKVLPFRFFIDWIEQRVKFSDLLRS